MWNPFVKRAALTSTHVLTPAVTQADLAPRTAILKKLKWINHRGRIGIVWELDSSGYATIHITDANGQTIAVDRVNATELQLAKYAEIPALRRVGLSQVYAATLGYF